MDNEVKIFNGGIACDDRGSLTFANDFNFKDVKRFYQVWNNDKRVIRAFHGHIKEGKYAYVPKGSVKLVLLKMDDSGKLMKDCKETMQEFVLSSKKPNIVFIPPGYANGFKCLEEDTLIIFFSTSTLDESKGDDYRFEYDVIGKDVWETENR